MKSITLMLALALTASVSFYRVWWRTFSIDTMPRTQVVLGFIGIIALWLFLFSINPWVGHREYIGVALSRKFLLVLVPVFVLAVFADGGWVLAHRVVYGPGHLYCQGQKHHRLHPK